MGLFYIHEKKLKRVEKNQSRKVLMWNVIDMDFIIGLVAPNTHTHILATLYSQSWMVRKLRGMLKNNISYSLCMW